LVTGPSGQIELIRSRELDSVCWRRARRVAGCDRLGRIPAMTDGLAILAAWVEFALLLGLLGWVVLHRHTRGDR
jgi:hypothetical protein